MCASGEEFSVRKKVYFCEFGHEKKRPAKLCCLDLFLAGDF